MPVLSAIIITKNEAANIAECLDSVAFCDERVVVDSGSDDDTVKIAQGRGARVSFHAFEGFGHQFNHALSLAQGDWVLSVDADERISSALAADGMPSKQVLADMGLSGMQIMSDNEAARIRGSGFIGWDAFDMFKDTLRDFHKQKRQFEKLVKKFDRELNKLSHKDHGMRPPKHDMKPPKHDMKPPKMPTGGGMGMGY